MKHETRRLFLTLTLSTSLFALGMINHAHASGHEEKKKGGGESYIQFTSLNVFTNIGRNRHGILTLDMGLDVPQEKLRAKVATYIPRLRDAYSRVLQSYALSLGADGLIDVNHVANILQIATDQTLKFKGAKVLLGGIMQT